MNNDINNPVVQEQRKIEINNIVNTVQNITNNDPVKEQLKKLFQQNYQLSHPRDLNERLLRTKPNKIIENRVLKTADIIVKEHLLSISKKTLWDVNCILYCIAISCKIVNNDVSEQLVQQRNANNQNG